MSSSLSSCPSSSLFSLILSCLPLFRLLFHLLSSLDLSSSLSSCLAPSLFSCPVFFPFVLSCLLLFFPLGRLFHLRQVLFAGWNTPIFLDRHLLICHPDSRIAYLGLPVWASPDPGTCLFGQTLTSPFIFFVFSLFTLQRVGFSEETARNKHTPTKTRPSRVLVGTPSKNGTFERIPDPRVLAKKCLFWENLR